MQIINSFKQIFVAIDMVALRYYSLSRAAEALFYVKQLHGLFEQSMPRTAVGLLTFMLQDINCKKDCWLHYLTHYKLCTFYNESMYDCIIFIPKLDLSGE